MRASAGNVSQSTYCHDMCPKLETLGPAAQKSTCSVRRPIQAKNFGFAAAPETTFFVEDCGLARRRPATAQPCAGAASQPKHLLGFGVRLVSLQSAPALPAGLLMSCAEACYDRLCVVAEAESSAVRF